MRLIIIGIQGAGKSTQGNLLSKQLRIPYLSTGHIFRQIAKEKTVWGRFVKETINAGHLIPDKETIAIVNEYLGRPEYKTGYILDGFPRNPLQAKAFLNNVDAVVYLKIPDKEAVWRIAGRNEDRADDTVAALKKRIEIFHTHTEPVIEFYRKKNILIEVDGMRSIKSINEYILKQLGKALGKKGLTNWRKRSRVLLAIVGLPGAGKDTAVNFFKRKKLPVIRLGDVTDDIIKEKGLSFTNEHERQVREGIRKDHGMDAYMKLNEENIIKLFEKAPVVVVNGLRSYEEFLRAKKTFKNVFILAIIADKKLRYKRIASRKVRNSVKGEERDVQEVLGLNIGPTIALSDKTIINNSSLSDFDDNLEDVYRQVYFGIR